MAKSKTRSAVSDAELKELTKQLAHDLAFYANGPVRISLQEGDAIAYTYNTADKLHAINIVMNPSILKGIRLKERAIAVWKGIGFHELCHHLHPAEEQYTVAIAEGFKALFNLMDDEQNERRGRKMNPAWGACFQTVCAYIFPTSKRDNGAISTGIVDGEEEHVPTGIEAEQTYTRRWNSFAFHLRRHVPNPADPIVKEALNLIPERYVDLSKDELLKLTREVHLMLATGIDIPEAQSIDSMEEEPIAPGSAAGTGSADGLPASRFALQGEKLLKSKWSYILLGIFVSLWAAWFMQAGAAFWCMVFTLVATIVVVAALVTALYLFRYRMAQRALLGLPPLGLSDFLKFKWALDWWKENEAAKPTKVKPAKLDIPKPSLWKRTFEIIGRVIDWISHKLWLLNYRYTDKFHGLKKLARKIGKAIDKFVSKVLSTIGKGIGQIHKLCVKLWKYPESRMAVLAIPFAIWLVMIYFVVTTYKELGWWALLLLLLLLLLPFAAWRYRKQIADFLQSQLKKDMDFMLEHCMKPDVDKETLEFNVINDIEHVSMDEQFLEEVMPLVNQLALVLRPALARMGHKRIDREDQHDGYDLIDELEQIHLGETAIFVDDQDDNQTSVHVEVAVDCSSSMHAATNILKVGQKFISAKVVGLAVEEAMRGQQGMSFHGWGFTDRNIYDCGTAGKRGISGLKCRGGNNDAAMLDRMGKSAAQSDKVVRILLMISDGQPSECSWGSLNLLKHKYEGMGMIPWNFLLEDIGESAFENNSTLIQNKDMTDAIVTMVHVLACMAL